MEDNRDYKTTMSENWQNVRASHKQARKSCIALLVEIKASWKRHKELSK